MLESDRRMKKKFVIILTHQSHPLTLALIEMQNRRMNKEVAVFSKVMHRFATLSYWIIDIECITSTLQRFLWTWVFGPTCVDPNAPVLAAFARGL